MISPGYVLLLLCDATSGGQLPNGSVETDVWPPCRLKQTSDEVR